MEEQEDNSRCYDFIEWVGADMSVKIFMFLDNPTHLVRASAVSTSWRRFGLFLHHFSTFYYFIAMYVFV